MSKKKYLEVLKKVIDAQIYLILFFSLTESEGSDSVSKIMIVL
jgi:hypothetical protein